MRGGPKWARADTGMFHPLVVEAFCQPLEVLGALLVAQMVKESTQNAGVWVRSLGWEHPLEEGMATHSSLLAWRTPWTAQPGGWRGALHSVTQSGTRLKQCSASARVFLMHFYIDV